jgi:hypothetical protein
MPTVLVKASTRPGTHSTSVGWSGVKRVESSEYLAQGGTSIRRAVAFGSVSRQKAMLAGEAFAAAPRTFVLETTRMPTPAAALDDVSTHDGAKQMIAVRLAGGDRGRSGHALIAVMKPADSGMVIPSGADQSGIA